LTPRGAVAWLLWRDSITGPWYEAVQLTDFDCYVNEWAPDGSGVLCSAPSGRALELVSPEGTVLWRREIGGRDRLRPVTDAEAQDVRYSRDGSTLYIAAVHEDGRAGVWALPVAGRRAAAGRRVRRPRGHRPGYLSVGRTGSISRWPSTRATSGWRRCSFERREDGKGAVPEVLEQVGDILSGRYAIERELGAGGMATVYLARDLKHERPVALKVLRPELSASLGAERFLAEIRLTASSSIPTSCRCSTVE
jgi:hypothetical protein